MRIYDCFMFNDEQEILELRLRYFKDIVDFFVVAESRMNFSGKPKEILSESVFLKVGIESKRIIRVNYEYSEEELELLSRPRGKYALERIARNSLLRIIHNLEDSDYVMLSDVDEIPTKNQLKCAILKPYVSSLVTPLHYGKMNWLSPDGSDWNTVKIGPSKFFKNQDLNTFKYKRFRVIGDNPGGHYSDQFKSVNEVLIKAKNSSHTEFNKEQGFQESLFEYSQEYRINHFGRFFRKGMGLIKQQGEVELNDIQKLAIKHGILEFDFSNQEKPTLIRILASYRVTKSWESGIPPLPVTQINLSELVQATLQFSKSAVSTRKRKVFHRLSILWE